MTTKQELAVEYAHKVLPYINLARKAYGSRGLDSPAHVANREYTKLLVEYHQKGGSLSQLSSIVGTSYSVLRKRVLMSEVFVEEVRPPVRTKNLDIKSAAQRVLSAKSTSVKDYHDQLAFEYSTGVSLSKLAKELGISSAAPLYYGVQKSLISRNTR
jgi:lambda repressor-like predicted transcriptional regulator